MSQPAGNWFAFTSRSTDQLPEELQARARRILESHRKRLPLGEVTVTVTAVDPPAGTVTVQTIRSVGGILRAAAALLDRALPGVGMSHRDPAVSPVGEGQVIARVEALVPPSGSTSWTGGGGNDLIAAASQLVREEMTKHRVARLDEPAAEEPTAEERGLLNLNFADGAGSDGFPLHWQEDQGPAEYAVLRGRGPGGATVVRIACATKPDAYAALYQALPAQGLVGSRIVWSGDLATEAIVDGTAQVSIVAWGPDGTLGAASAPFPGLQGDNVWKRCAAELTVPAGTTSLTLGSSLIGAGTLFATNFDLQVTSD